MIYAVWLEDEKNNKSLMEPCEDRDVGTKFSKIQHDVAWKLFEYALKKEYDIDFSECTIQRNRFGKPSLKEYHDIYFSISHCKSLAVCILADDEVGIDVETLGRRCRENVWRRMLSDAEYERIVNMADTADERDREFLRYWTLKESYGKAIGTGLSYDYKAVTFAVEGAFVTSNVPDYKLWQTTVKNEDKEIIVSVCRKQETDFCECIEWVEI